MSDYTSKRALVDSIMKNVLITTEEGFELRGEIVDLIKNQPTLDEKEIIRKAFERVVERLEEEERTLQDKYERNLKKEYDDPFVSGRLCELECVIEIVKKEGRLNV